VAAWFVMTKKQLPDALNDLEFLPHPNRLFVANGVGAKASLGQNFLANRGVLTKILKAVLGTHPATVVEIGPGLGHLTFLLAQTCRRVIAVELDDNLADLLRKRFWGYDHVEIIHGDALQLDRLEPLRHMPAPRTVVGNLPFGSSTQILFRVLDLDPPVEKAFLMFQKEVARRIVAPPGGRDYGALTVACAARAQAELLFHVSAGSFHPKPDVDGSVLALTTRRRLPKCCLERLRELLKAAFGARRKTLRNALKKGGLWSAVQKLPAMADLEPSRVRPEKIEPERYFLLAHQLCDAQGAHRDAGFGPGDGTHGHG
jgi:16S rRNA (adenine1518-N6/adenine1519-N6)-dimethyltransferase